MPSARRDVPRLVQSFVAALLLLLVWPTTAEAQTATLRGFVRDAADGLTLTGVNVGLIAADGTLLGSATNIDGFYAISRLAPGRYVLRGTYIGYQTHADTLVLAADEVRTYSFEIGLSAESMDEIIVEENREGAGGAAVTAGLQTVRPQDIELIPTPDVSGDLVSYLTTIPGVVSSGDQGGQLFIRGGEPTQNLVMIDGMLVYQPFHLIGFYSAFPSDIMTATEVYAGGFGARYGGRISSVIDITSRNGNKRRFAGMASVAPFVSGARIEGPLVQDRASVLLSGRTSVIEQGADRLVDAPLPYRFDDQFGKLHIVLNENNQVSFSAIRSYDRGIVGQQTAEGIANPNSDRIVWENVAYGMRYLLLPTTIPVLAEILISNSEVLNEFGPSAQPSRVAEAKQFNAATNVTHFVGRTDIRWGAYLRSSRLQSELGGRIQNVSADREFVAEAGGYLEPEIRVESGTGLRIQPGIRFQTFPSKGRTFIEPRFRAVQDYGFHRFSLAAGLYHQEIVGINDRRDAGDVFTAWTSSNTSDVAEALHIVGGYQLSTAAGIGFSLEGYYKDLSNLSVAEWTSFPRFTTQLQPADGTVVGFDVRLELDTRSFYGLVSYGYADVEYRARQDQLPIWYGVDELVYSPPHDRTHQVNAIGAITAGDFQLSVRWQYGSGLPFSESLGFDEFVLLAGPTDVTTTAGGPRVLYGLPYRGRLPDYHRLDASLDWERNVAKDVGLTLQVGVTNAYDRQNLFYIDLFTLNRLDQLPLIPSFGLRIDYR